MSNRIFVGDACFLFADEVLRFNNVTIGGDGHRHMLRVSQTNSGMIIQGLGDNQKIIVDGVHDIESFITKINTGIETK